MADGTHFHWGLRFKTAPEQLIGIISLRPNDEGDDQRGFWLDPAHHGAGLMFEAAERVTEFAFVDLGMAALTIGNAVENRASGHIKEKQGARLLRTELGDFVAGRLVKQVWQLDRAEWLARRRAR
jgi:RimJ/RimL family protein N-acetyltransferase